MVVFTSAQHKVVGGGGNHRSQYSSGTRVRTVIQCRSNIRTELGHSSMLLATAAWAIEAVRSGCPSTAAASIRSPSAPEKGDTQAAPNAWASRFASVVFPA